MQAIAHSLGEKYNITHGLTNATLLDVVLKQYGESVYKKLYEMACIVASVMRMIPLRLGLSVLLNKSL